jgi:hypothetical protein
MGAPKKDEVRIARGYRTTPTIMELIEKARKKIHGKRKPSESRWVETAIIEKLEREGLL